MLKEFKEFAMRGNVIDLAVGVIIGGAFGKIITSLVTDIIMPIVGLLLNGVDFNGLNVPVGAASINYGLFIQALVDFFIIAFVIFIAIKQINKLKKPIPVAEPATKQCPHCCLDIPLKATRCGHCTSQLSEHAIL